MPRRRGLTLIELLVVIGIVGVLVGLLLPAFTTARRSAQTARCAANLGSIGRAFMAYVTDNQGATPMCGDNVVVSSPQKEDWVHWQAGATRKMTESAFAKYLNFSLEVDEEGNKKSDIMLCPADDPGRGNRGGTERYPFSYSMNVLIGNFPPTSNIFAMNMDITPNMKLRKIKSPSKKIAFACESEYTVNDSAWAPKIMPGFPNVDWISSRHGKNKDRVFSAGGLDRRNLDMGARSNVAFADGHVQLVDRNFAHAEPNYHPLK